MEGTKGRGKEEQFLQAVKKKVKKERDPGGGKESKEKT